MTADHEIALSHAKDVLSEDFEESILVAPGNGERWLILRGTAATVWRLLSEPQTLAGLREELTRAFAGPPDRIEDDVRQLLERLTSARVIGPGAS